MCPYSLCGHLEKSKLFTKCWVDDNYLSSNFKKLTPLETKLTKQGSKEEMFGLVRRSWRAAWNIWNKHLLVKNAKYISQYMLNKTLDIHSLLISDNSTIHVSYTLYYIVILSFTGRNIPEQVLYFLWFCISGILACPVVWLLPTFINLRSFPKTALVMLS